MKKNGEPNCCGEGKASFFQPIKDFPGRKSPFPGRIDVRSEIISAAFPFYHLPLLASRIIRLIFALIKGMETDTVYIFNWKGRMNVALPSVSNRVPFIQLYEQEIRSAY